MSFRFVFFVIVSLFLSACIAGKNNASSGSEKVVRTLRRVGLVDEERSFYQMDAVKNLLFVNGGMDGLLVYRIESNRQVSFLAAFSNRMIFRDVKVIQSDNERTLVFAVYFLPEHNHTAVGVFSFSQGVLRPFILYQALKDVSTHRVCDIKKLENGELRVTTADWKQGIQDYEVDLESQVIVPIEPVLLDTLPAFDVVGTDTHWYVAAGRGGLLVLDRNGRIEEHYFNALSFSGKILINGSYLILGDRINGIRFFELDSEGRPEYITQYDTTGDANDFFVRADGKEMIIADGANGLVWLGIDDPKEPVLYGHFMEIDNLIYDTVATPMFPDIVFASAGTSGLEIFELNVRTNHLASVLSEKNKTRQKKHAEKGKAKSK